MSDPVPPKPPAPPLPPPPPPAGAARTSAALMELDAPMVPPSRAVSGPQPRPASAPIEVTPAPLEPRRPALVAPPQAAASESPSVEPPPEASAPVEPSPAPAIEPPVRAESGPFAVGEGATVDDLMFDLDGPVRGSTVDLEPERASTLDLDAEDVPFAEAKAAPGRPERLVAMPAPEPARSAEEQLEQRRARVVERVATVRDTFRLLTEVGIPDDARKAVAQALQELQSSVGTSGAASLFKDPKACLAAVAKEGLEAVESQLGAIEERVLSIDDQVEDAVFEARVPAAARNKKVIARYGRLLASRRMPVGGRRNRFEWLVMQLLTRTNAAGQLVVAPPERARPALQHLVGDLPRKVRQEEIDQATDYLFEAGERLDALKNVYQLFESGLYADVHGHKVSMREHLLSPEFIYRIALFEAKLHNLLERWVSSQVAAAGEGADGSALRAALKSRLTAERDDVDRRLGGKLRGQPVALGSISLPEPAAHPQLQPAAPVKEKKKKRGRKHEADERKLQRLRFMLDRALLIGLPLLVAAAVVTFVVRDLSGLSSEPTMRKLTPQEMPALSPLLVAGELRSLDEDKSVHGWISGTRWRALDPAARRTAAEDMARNMKAAGIGAAKLHDHAEVVILIQDGIVISAAGAAP